MTSTTFAQRTGGQPARARVGTCVQPVVDLGLAASAYRAWQMSAISGAVAHRVDTANADVEPSAEITAPDSGFPSSSLTVPVSSEGAIGADTLEAFT